MEKLRPLESFLGGLFPDGVIHDALFQFFRLFHLYLNEYVDYLLFLLIVVPPFYLVPKAFRAPYLLLTSLGMIGWWFGFDFMLAVLLFTWAIQFWVSRWKEKTAHDPRLRKQHTACLIIITLLFYGVLLYIESTETELSLGILGIFSPPLLHLCGVAFMLPKVIHYVVEGLAGRFRHTDAIPTLLFFHFFPFLRLGPIERYAHFSQDVTRISQTKVEAFDIGYGLYRLLLGGTKTVLYSGVLYPFREYATLHYDQISWTWSYTLFYIGIAEIWCHFGGYTDIALGSARLFGIRGMENFYFPFLAPNLGELWRRWHITLSFWFRDYVYLPLGGNRRWPALAGMVTFGLCGLWHQFSLNFLVWGLLQAIGIMIWRTWATFWYRIDHRPDAPWLLALPNRFMGRHPRLSWALGTFVTLHYFCLTGIFFLGDFDKCWVFVSRLLTLAQ